MDAQAARQNTTIIAVCSALDTPSSWWDHLMSCGVVGEGVAIFVCLLFVAWRGGLHRATARGLSRA